MEEEKKKKTNPFFQDVRRVADECDSASAHFNKKSEKITPFIQRVQNNVCYNFSFNNHLSAVGAGGAGCSKVRTARV